MSTEKDSTGSTVPTVIGIPSPNKDKEKAKQEAKAAEAAKASGGQDKGVARFLHALGGKAGALRGDLREAILWSLVSTAQQYRGEADRLEAAGMLWLADMAKEHAAKCEEAYTCLA